MLATLHRVVLLVLAAVTACGSAAAQQANLQVMGIGGAGGMYTPAVSPTNPNLMLVSCDMGGSYRSTDGGQHWQMIHWSQLSNSRECRPLFINGAVIWVSGATPKISRDDGLTWKPLVAGPLPWKGQVIRMAASAGPDPVLLFGASAGEVWRSADLGKTWALSHKSWRVYDILALGAKFYLAIGDSFLISSDKGLTWKPVDLTASIPEAKGATFLSLAGGQAGGKTVLYGPIFKAGMYQSLNDGQTWRKVDQFRDCNTVTMATNQTQIAYEAMSGYGGATGFFRTMDGGKTWQQAFRMNGADANVERSWVQTQLHWGYYISPLGVGVCASDANTALISTQGDFYVTHDDGNTWRQLMNIPLPPAPGETSPRYECNGLEVTSSWGYYFDPNDTNRTYIAYTDIGFCRSLDRGKSWINSVKGCPWANTFYHIAFDPFVKGRLYAACSNRHDIPHWTQTASGSGSPWNTGGVCVSDDFGRTWQSLGTGLPGLPCTSICIDPRSTPGALTTYVTMYGSGVYKSIDSGKTWAPRNNGLGNPGNMHALSVQVHPKTGAVFCSISAMRQGDRDFPVPGGLWKSKDGGGSWTDITKSLRLHWPGNFAIDPNNDNIIYLTAGTIPGGAEGGVYKTTNGGATWKRLLTDADFAATGPPGYVQCFYVNLNPKNPDHVYLGAESHGLWLSPDAGKTWKRYEPLPFTSATNVSFDPENPTMIYICTFGGGVWQTTDPLDK